MEYIHEYKNAKHIARLYIKCIYITTGQTSKVLQKLFHFMSECMCMALNISENFYFVNISMQGNKCKIGHVTLHLIKLQNSTGTQKQNV
jgi:hypothetical protein